MLFDRHILPELIYEGLMIKMMAIQFMSVAIMKLVNQWIYKYS